MTRTRIIFAPRAPADPPTYWLLGPLGEVAERGELPVGAAAPPDVRDVLVVPGEEVASRWLKLPVGHQRQARAAAALMLADRQALAAEDLHVAVGSAEADGHRLVLAISRGALQGRLAAAALHGVRPVAALPDYLLLAEPEAEGAVSTAAFGPILAARGRRFAAGLEPELAEVVLHGREVQRIEERALEAMARQACAAPPVDLLQGEFAPGGRLEIAPSRRRRLLALAALALLSPVILFAAQALRHDLAARRLEAETAAKVAAVLPKGTSVQDPLRQAAERLARAELATGGGPAGLAARFFTALEGLEGVQLESLILDPGGGLRAQILCLNASDLELLRTALRRDGVALREAGVREAGGGVLADVIVGTRG
ncbi:MAG: type II secretion system protein GspL [Phenylobacterium sp.]|uniref:type II secretion system protein GspL n=1 Tax=Phenylobacterium sp. TaxID=1871053 RepID=UPI00391933E7